MRIVSKSLCSFRTITGPISFEHSLCTGLMVKIEDIISVHSVTLKNVWTKVLKAFINPAFLQSSVYVRWEFKEICYYLHHLVILFLHIICISIVASYVCSTQPHSFALLSCLYLLACKHTSFGICSYVVTYFHIVLVRPVGYFVSL